MIYIDSLNDKAFELLASPVFSGLTTNPTIIKKDKPEFGFEKALNFLQGLEGSHFIQGSLNNSKWIDILTTKIRNNEIDPSKFTIKLPWVSDKAPMYVETLHNLGLKVCATAVYSLEQCYSAILAKVEFVAVYYDRMKKSNINSDEIIAQMVDLSYREESNTRILAASIKDVTTANNLLLNGVQDLTLPLDICEAFLKSHFPMNDCEVFENDFRI